MTAPKKAAPRKATPRKAPAPKAPPTAGEATEAEATGRSIDLTFRGQKLELSRERLGSFHMISAMREGDFITIFNVAFDPVQKAQILALVGYGENPVDVGIELTNLIGEAAGWGNSEASG